jgi:hypothetical protein
VVRAFGEGWIAHVLRRNASGRPATVQDAIQSRRSDHNGDYRDQEDHLSLEGRVITRPSAFFESCQPRKAKQDEARNDHAEHKKGYRSSHGFCPKSSVGSRFSDAHHLDRDLTNLGNLLLRCAALFRLVRCLRHVDLILGNVHFALTEPLGRRTAASTEIRPAFWIV